MMGRQQQPEQLFYTFQLDHHVPSDHRLGLEGAVPDHSTFSKNRHGRFRESDLFRLLFEDVVRSCMRVGLVGGEGFAIDASVIEADASHGRKVDGKPATWPDDEQITRPVREYLTALDQAMEAEAAKSDPGDDMPQSSVYSSSKMPTYMTGCALRMLSALRLSSGVIASIHLLQLAGSVVSPLAMPLARSRSYLGSGTKVGLCHPTTNILPPLKWPLNGPRSMGLNVAVDGLWLT